MQLTPYLFFDGRCEEALAFYGKALGAKVTMLMRNKESPEPRPPEHARPGTEEKVMHCEVQIGEVSFMASDGFCGGKPEFKGFSLALTVKDATEVDKAIKALADLGRIDMPASKTFWAERFGMVTDRFGVQWMLTTPSPTDR
jgi:PhnB protein